MGSRFEAANSSRPTSDEGWGQFRDRVFRLAARLVPADAAEDIAQETSMTALLTGDRARSFRAWTHSVVRHKAIDSRGVRPTHSIEQLELEIEDTRARSLDRKHVDEELGERLGHVGKVLRVLTPNQRDALYLSLDGLDALEVAAIMKASPPTVRKWISRGRARLRKEFTAEAMKAILFMKSGE